MGVAKSMGSKFYTSQIPEYLLSRLQQGTPSDLANPISILALNLRGFVWAAIEESWPGCSTV